MVGRATAEWGLCMRWRAGQTALMAAVRGEHTPAVAILLKAGAAPLLENYADATALDAAEVQQCLEHCRNTHASMRPGRGFCTSADLRLTEAGPARRQRKTARSSSSCSQP